MKTRPDSFFTERSVEHGRDALDYSVSTESTASVHTERALTSTHLDTGRHIAETLDGQIVDVGYVDTRALLAHHEAVTKDAHARVAGDVQSYIQEDAHRDAELLASTHMIQTATETAGLLASKKESDDNDVFGRALRSLTSTFGSESILRLKSIPDWSIAQGNSPEMNTAIYANLAFMIPKSLAREVQDTFSYYSSMDISNSGERTKGTILTDQRRGGITEYDTYMTIPITIDGNVHQLYFLYGKEHSTASTGSRSKERVAYYEQIAKEAGLSVTQVETLPPAEQVQWCLSILATILRGQGTISGDQAIVLLRSTLDVLASKDVAGISDQAVEQLVPFLDALEIQLSGAYIADLSAHDAAGIWDGSSVLIDPYVIQTGNIDYVSQVRTHEEYHAKHEHHIPLRRGTQVASMDATVFQIGGLMFSQRELIEGLNTLDVDKGALAAYSADEYRAYAQKVLRAATQCTEHTLDEIRHAVNVSKDMSLVDDRDVTPVHIPSDPLITPTQRQTRQEALPDHSSTVDDMAA